MKDVLDNVEKWLHQGYSVALATVVGKQGSSPRDTGTVMAVSSNGEVAGSISGGCVEGAVVEEALAVIAQGKPRLISYGVADELGFEVGLTCGGTIQIFVERLARQNVEDLPLDTLFEALRRSQKKPLILCTMVEGRKAGAKMIVTSQGTLIGSLDNPDLDRVVARDAQGLLAQGLNELRHYGSKGERLETDVAVFIQSFALAPHLIVFGAVDFSLALCKLGKMLGYRITVCDARSRFATPARFPDADEVVVSWPSEYLESIHVDDRTIILVLTHDPKFDVPALMSAVRTPAAYIGAMGSRKANADRLRRLKEAGMNNTELARIAAPIGLDIGASTSEETAVSIMAEIIALKSGRSGGRLSQNQNPIHPR